MSNVCIPSSGLLAGGRSLVCHTLEASSNDSFSCEVFARLESVWRVLVTPTGLSGKRDNA